MAITASYVSMRFSSYVTLRVNSLMVWLSAADAGTAIASMFVTNDAKTVTVYFDMANLQERPSSDGLFFPEGLCSLMARLAEFARPVADPVVGRPDGIRREFTGDRIREMERQRAGFGIGMIPGCRCVSTAVW